MHDLYAYSTYGYRQTIAFKLLQIIIFNCVVFTQQVYAQLFIYTWPWSLSCNYGPILLACITVYYYNYTLPTVIGQ